MTVRRVTELAVLAIELYGFLAPDPATGRTILIEADPDAVLAEIVGRTASAPSSGRAGRTAPVA